MRGAKAVSWSKKAASQPLRGGINDDRGFPGRKIVGHSENALRHDRSGIPRGDAIARSVAGRAGDGVFIQLGCRARFQNAFRGQGKETAAAIRVNQKTGSVGRGHTGRIGGEGGRIKGLFWKKPPASNSKVSPSTSVVAEARESLSTPSLQARSSRVAPCLNFLCPVSQGELVCRREGAVDFRQGDGALRHIQQARTAPATRKPMSPSPGAFRPGLGKVRGGFAVAVSLGGRGDGRTGNSAWPCGEVGPSTWRCFQTAAPRRPSSGSWQPPQRPKSATARLNACRGGLKDSDQVGFAVILVVAVDAQPRRLAGQEQRDHDHPSRPLAPPPAPCSSGT